MKNAVRELRKSGELVVFELPGAKSEHDEFVCDRELVCETENGNWNVKTVSKDE